MKMRKKRVEEAHSQEPYDNDIAFLKYMRKCINSDCATPWNSDKISEALKVIFCRETEKKSIADILTEIIDTDGFKEANVFMYIRHQDSKLLETFKENIKTKEELEEFSYRLEEFADRLR